MSRLVDLDDLDGDALLDLWNETDRVRRIREIDPELRRDLEHWLPTMQPELAREIRGALDEMAPMVVLNVFWPEFSEAIFGTKPQPTVGTFRDRGETA